MTVPSVLAVFAHPDDESLSAGGLLARTASEGGRAAVVTSTWRADTQRAMEQWSATFATSARTSSSRTTPLAGSPDTRDHLQTHRVTVLAAQAAALDGLYPDAGPPWTATSLYLATHPHSAMDTLTRIIGARKARFSVPDDHVALCLDVSPWLDQKIDAILSHRSEVRRGALPGLVANLTPSARAELLSTEWYTCWSCLRPPVEGDLAAG